MFYPSSHPWVKGETLAEHLENRGVSRRDFVAYCAELGAILGLSSVLTPKVAEALQQVESLGVLSPALNAFGPALDVAMKRRFAARLGVKDVDDALL